MRWRGKNEVMAYWEGRGGRDRMGGIEKGGVEGVMSGVGEGCMSYDN